MPRYVLNCYTVAFYAYEHRVGEKEKLCCCCCCCYCVVVYDVRSSIFIRGVAMTAHKTKEQTRHATNKETSKVFFADRRERKEEPTWKAEEKSQLTKKKKPTDRHSFSLGPACVAPSELQNSVCVCTTHAVHSLFMGTTTSFSPVLSALFVCVPAA